jgi:hypothetical protein
MRPEAGGHARQAEGHTSQAEGHTAWAKQRDIHAQAEGHTQSRLVKAASFVILVHSDSCALKTARANQGGTGSSQGSSISIVEMLLPDHAGERATATRAE